MPNQAQPVNLQPCRKLITTWLLELVAILTSILFGFWACSDWTGISVIRILCTMVQATVWFLIPLTLAICNGQSGLPHGLAWHYSRFLGLDRRRPLPIASASIAVIALLAVSYLLDNFHPHTAIMGVFIITFLALPIAKSLQG